MLGRVNNAIGDRNLTPFSGKSVRLYVSILSTPLPDTLRQAKRCEQLPCALYVSDTGSPCALSFRNATKLSQAGDR